MPPGTQQPLVIDWTGVKTDKSDRKILSTELTTLRNTRRLKDGEYDKRLGYGRALVSTFNGGSVYDTLTSNSLTKAMECAEKPLWRTNDDRLWLYDDGTGEGYYRGLHLRAFPSWTGLQNLGDPATKPVAVRKGDDIWVFALAGPNSYQLTVVDAETDPDVLIVRENTRAFTVSGIVALSVLLDGSNVRLFTVSGGTTISCHTFTSPSSTPTTTTWHTQAGAQFVAVSARFIQSKSCVAALSGLFDGTTTVSSAGVLRSHGTTGAAAAASYSASGTSIYQGYTGLSVLSSAGSDGFWDIAFYGNPLAPGGAVYSSDLILQTISLAAPGALTAVTLGTVNYNGLGTMIATTSGAVRTNGERVVFATTAPFNGTDSRVQTPNRLTVTRYIRSGGVTTSGVVARSAYVASDPFTVGGVLYLLTGFDDSDYTGGADIGTGVQNGYFVRREDGRIVTSVLDGDAAVFSHGVIDGVYGYQRVSSATSHVVPALVSGSKVFLPLLSAGIVRTSPQVQLATVDWDAEFFSSASGVITGQPVCASASDAMTELAPIHSPYSNPTASITYTPGAIAASFYWSFLYKSTNSAGDVTRSAPYPIGLTPWTGTITGPMSIALPTDRHQLGDRLEIEFYGSVSGDPLLYLQDTIPNDPTVDTVTFDFNPLTFRVQGEPLYSTNGIPNIPPDPARLAWKQGMRTMLGGTPSGEVWPSHEQRPGNGPEFHPALNYQTTQFGTGPLRAACALADDSSALFKRDGIAVATGNPDGRGSGGWIVTTLRTNKGCDSATEVCEHPLGAVFRNASDGRMNLLAGTSVVECSQGMEEFVAKRFSAALRCADGTIRFYADDGVLVLDTRHPLPDQPAGTWSWDEGAGLPEAIGARVIDGRPVLMTSGLTGAAEVWSENPGTADADWTDNGVEILQDFSSGRIAPPGFLSEFDTDWVTLSSTHLGGTSTYEYTITGTDNAEVHTDAASTVADVAFRSGLMRTREFRLRIRETSATGRGRRFDGAAVDYRSYGRVRVPNRLIA